MASESSGDQLPHHFTQMLDQAARQDKSGEKVVLKVSTKIIII